MKCEWGFFVASQLKDCSQGEVKYSHVDEKQVAAMSSMSSTPTTYIEVEPPVVRRIQAVWDNAYRGNNDMRELMLASDKLDDRSFVLLPNPEQKRVLLNLFARSKLNSSSSPIS